MPGSGELATPEALSSIAIRAEELGFASLWLADHVALPKEPKSKYPYSNSGLVPWAPQERWLDPLITLGFLAAQTERILLGTSVLVLPMRNTLVVAKQSAVVDVLSGGRLMLGVGAGWLKEEFELLQADFRNRGASLVEAITVMKKCWRDEYITFEGEYHNLSPFSMEPKPVQGDSLPVLYGGKSRKAIQRAALICDGWHPSNIGPDEYRLLRQELQEELEKGQRDPMAFLLTARPGRSIQMDPELLRSYAQAGAKHVVADIEYRSIASSAAALNALEDLAILLLPTEGP